jgi:hypothetical protein
VSTDVFEDQDAAPPIVPDHAHRRFTPCGVTLPSIDDGRADLVVAVAKNVGFNDKTPSEDAFRRKPAAIDIRRNLLDSDPISRQHAKTVERSLFLFVNRTFQSARLPLLDVPASMISDANSVPGSNVDPGATPVENAKEA